jgi:UDP-glucuronate decarboxylase
MNRIIEEDLEYIISADIPWDVLEGKNILISGANGFLPAYMVETILFLNDHRFKKKAKVFALVRNKVRSFNRFSLYMGRKDIEYIIQDVCIPILEKAHFDFIIHAASQASPKYYGIDPVGTISANTIGTANLLNTAINNKSECLLFFSSGAVYGEVVKRNMAIKEDNYGYIDPIDIRSCYAEGKRAGENMCVSWNKQYGLPVKIVRPFHIYGPGMRLDDRRVYADFVSDIILNKNIKIKSDGSAIRAFCYLADAVTGFFTVLLKGESTHAYNIGNEEGEISIRDLAAMLVSLFPEKGLKVEMNVKANQDGYINSNISYNSPDTGKLLNLGWKPYYSLKEGFKRTVRSFLGE